MNARPHRTRSSVPAVALLVSMASTACGGAARGVPSPPATTIEAIALERGPCYGRCPVYRVQVTRDGTVRFEGARFVADSGAHTGRLASVAADALLARAATAPFGGADSVYADGSTGCGAWVTDAPSLTLRRTRRLGRDAAQDDTLVVESVHLDTGCTGAPRWITELAAAIDSAAGTERWITRGSNDR